MNVKDEMYVIALANSRGVPVIAQQSFSYYLSMLIFERKTIKR